MKAIIVIGAPNEQDFKSGVTDRFTLRAAMINKALRSYLGFADDEVAFFASDGAPASIAVEIKAFENYLIAHSSEDLCLFYVGHGWEDAWALSGTRENALTYQQLGLFLVHHQANLIFVNYCCHAGAATEALMYKLGEWLLLAAMPRDISGYAYKFCLHVLTAWIKRSFFDSHLAAGYEPYLPPIFGNENLQRLIFAKADKAREVVS